MTPRTGKKAGQFIQVGSGETAYRAFVPDPLPPDIPANWHLTGLLSEADRATSELAGVGRALPDPHLFIRPLIRREAVLSSRIEGTTSNLQDLYAYESRQLPLPGFSVPEMQDVEEVLTYVNALEYGLQRINQLPISLRLIREIHERLMHGVRGQHAAPGEFRSTQNWIGGRTINTARYVPPPVEQMKRALDSFEVYIHNKEHLYPPLVRLAFIHYQFEAIHPFADGNGRVGRLLLALLLVEWKLIPQPLLYLSAYFERTRSEYYDRLLHVSEKNEWLEWVDYFLRAVTVEAQQACERIKRLDDLQKTWRTQLAQARVSSSTLRLMEKLFSIPILDIPKAQQYLEVSYKTAKRAVMKLIEKGILIQLDEGKYKKTYYSPDIISVVMSEDHQLSS